MPTFHSRLQQAIVDGRVALWMLAGVPLLLRGLVVLLPYIEDAVNQDADVLGMILVVAVGVRIFMTIAGLLLGSTQKKRWEGAAFDYRYMIASVAIFIAYYFLTSMLPLSVALAIDITAAVLILKNPRGLPADLVAAFIRDSFRFRF